ncbi:phage N-6-adenine-methyltransferase [Gracilimonas mengyeensis]|uniref:DNA N-6-adenine-methyltransferase (Dam) n=1 Tax=Gracilimonas mengyeensis TaxID=1302730 RepID=A0A521EWB9_9BACT|nr:phage N-6-adenine-methyltransferase [Gracilimonas mengyeensis]SMO87390.1 DNA N-6-adenine-methyltransferase (Dam) [Gracilimonas mengyeensis]
MMNLFDTEKTQSLHIRNKEDYTDIWLTPPEIIQALGQFDLDPCAHIEQPWETAKTMYTIKDDGYSKEWFGRVWMNPPYSEIDRWMQKLSIYGNGIALTFARTETQYFHNYVWGKAKGIFFFDGRLNFHRANGVKAKMNAGAPSVLIAYGRENAEVLKTCKLRGFYTEL